MIAISNWFLRDLAGQIDALGQQLARQQAATEQQFASLNARLQQISIRMVAAMSDLKTDIANLQGDVTSLKTIVPQVLTLLQQYHDAAGNAVASGDLAALAQMHTDMGPTIASLQAALPAVTTAQPGA